MKRKESKLNPTESLHAKLKENMKILTTIAERVSIMKKQNSKHDQIWVKKGKNNRLSSQFDDFDCS